MTVFNNTLLLADAVTTAGYQISRSLRFNSADSAYLSHAFGTPTTQNTFTFSTWVKRSGLGSTTQLFGVSTNHSLGFTSGDALNLTFGGISALTTTALFRDPSAWYHIVWVQSGTAHTLYVNNTSVGTATATSSVFNTAVSHQIGAANTTNYFNGYLADIHFIDGQALTPSSFGFTDANGIWQPKAYSGSYGTNGFKLTFSDNSTAAALGTDTSGNGNTWTVNNLSPTIVAATIYVSTGVTAASGGTIANGGTPYWVDISPANANLAYSGAMTNVHDDSLTSYTYWVGDQYPGQGDVLQARLDLRDFGNTVSSVRVYYSFYSGGYVPYSARLLDATKTYIAGSQVTLSNLGPLWVSLPVSGTPRYLEFFTSSGTLRRLNLHAIEVNGTVLVSRGALISDSLVDSPTNYGTDAGVGGEVRGNYAIFNALAGSGTLANGNLDATGTIYRTGTIGVTSGKWYYELTVGSVVINSYAGVYPDTSSAATGYVVWGTGGYFSTAGGTQNFSSTTISQGDLIGVAFDRDNGTFSIYRNGTYLGQYTGLSLGSNPWFLGMHTNNATTTAWSVNFGQSPFTYTAPSGFKALCTQNFPTPVVANPATVMDVKLYTGNGGTQSITGLGFSPDLVWIKGRSGATDHALYDTVRGVQLDLVSNSTAAETTQSTGLTAFNSAGFSVGALAKLNTNAATYATWCWDAGNTIVTNTQGSITSQVRANASAGFSIVTYTGTGANATVGHGLGVVPGLVIVKSRGNNLTSWGVWHSTFAGTEYALLNTTGAKTTGATLWNSTSPSSTVFSCGTNTTINQITINYVAYCFAPVAGYSAFGSYTGNGSTDGPFVYTNMLPRWILVKRTDTTSNWTIIDTARAGYNVDNDPLYPNLSSAEGTTDLADILSNGFKLRTIDASVNANAGTYIYACFAFSPFAYSRSR